MASYQYVYHMDGVAKTYGGGKKLFENIRLSFLPGVKIGVVGVNGSGKSTLMRIMTGLDRDFSGEAWAAKGIRVGYLAQEPRLDEAKDVRANVMEGVAAKLAEHRQTRTRLYRNGQNCIADRRCRVESAPWNCRWIKYQFASVI